MRLASNLKMSIVLSKYFVYLSNLQLFTIFLLIIKTKFHKYAKLIKHFNGRCNSQQHITACATLDNLVSMGSCSMDQKDHLQICFGEERYIFNCKLQQWTKITKRKLLQHQSNFLFKSRLFRIDSSEHIGQTLDVKKIKELLLVREKLYGILRFKRIKCYKAHQYYNIWSSTVSENNSEEWLIEIQKLIGQNGNNFAQAIKAIIQHRKKSEKAKYWLQLRFTQKGVDVLRKGLNNQAKQIFSNALDFFTQISLKNFKNQVNQIRQNSGNLLLKKIYAQNEEEKPKIEKAKQKKNQSQEQEEVWYIVK